MLTALIVGAGASGLLHSLALKSADVSIAAIFDPDLARAALLADLVGGEPCRDFTSALQSSCAVVAICSPPIRHVAQAVALARPGRLTLLEKPIALDGDELIRLSGCPNIVPTLQWRAGRSARQLRAAIAEGCFGPRPRISCDLRLWRDDAYYEAGRRGKAQWGCGAMLSIGIHAIDLALYVVNVAVRDARGSEWSGRPGLDVTTESELAIDFDGGAAARIRITTNAKGCNDVRLRVEGDGAEATLLADENDPTAAPLKWRGASQSSTEGATGSPLLVPFVHEAVAAFRSGRQSLSVADVADAHRLAFGLERV